jgi:hypothetical protein
MGRRSGGGRADGALRHHCGDAAEPGPNPSELLNARYGSIFGVLLHAVKWRPEISAALGNCGTCLTICNEEMYQSLIRNLVYFGRTRRVGTTFSAHLPGAAKLRAYTDANWTTTRSTAGYVITLAGAAIAYERVAPAALHHHVNVSGRAD